jgi:isoquinoline 1-oxidoreductase beta subunit
MSGIFRVTRRDFLRDLGVGTGALVLGCAISPESLFASKLSKLEDMITEGIPLGSAGAFVAIKPLSGEIIIMAHRSEMGQGIRSSLAAVLADELEADWSRGRVHQAEADGPRYAIANPDPSGTPRFLISEEGAQFADSSRSMCAYYTPMRLLGAGVRLVMVRAAALKFGVDPSECQALQHRVYHKRSGRSAEYQHLLLEAQKAAVPSLDEVKAALKKPKDFLFIGTEKMPFVDAQDMVTGKVVSVADADPHRPGMLTAMIVRCPVANGEVKSFDDTETRKVPGVVNVVKMRLPVTGGVGGGFAPHAGVAVVAKNTWAAWQGRRALKVEWDLGPNATYDSKAYRSELEASTAKPGKTLRSRGDVDAAFGVASKVVERDYYVPHLAQAPMEPPAAVALYEDGRWQIWSPTQGPELTQHYVGLAMLEPDPLKWLIWQVTEPAEILKDCERQDQIAFNVLVGKRQTDVPTSRTE